MILGRRLFVLLHTVWRTLLLLGILLTFVLMVAAPAKARVPDSGSTDRKQDATGLALFVFTPSWIGYADIPQHPVLDDLPFDDDGPTTNVPEQYTETVELTAEVGMCTGFFVTQSGYAATAAHCVDEQQARYALQSELRQKLRERADESGRTSGSIGQPLPEIYDITIDRLMIKQVYWSATVRDWREVSVRAIRPLDKGSDYAVLKLDDPPKDIPYLDFATTIPDPTDTFRAVGYPGSHISGLDRQFDPDAPEESIKDLIDDSDVRPTTTTGTFSGRQVVKGVELYETDTAMDPGMSGGPCVNEDGEVIGVISGGFGSVSGGEFNLCAPAEPLVAELRQLGALPIPGVLPEMTEYDPSSNMPAPKAASKNFDNDSMLVPLWLAVVIGVGGLALGTLLRYLPRRKAKVSSSAAESSVTPTKERQDNGTP